MRDPRHPPGFGGNASRTCSMAANPCFPVTCLVLACVAAVNALFIRETRGEPIVPGRDRNALQGCRSGI